MFFVDANKNVPVIHDIVDDVNSDVIADVNNDVIGDVIHDVIGYVNSDVIGDVIHEVIGDVHSDVIGDVIHEVIGDVNPDVIGDVFPLLRSRAKQQNVKVIHWLMSAFLRPCRRKWKGKWGSGRKKGEEEEK